MAITLFFKNKHTREIDGSIVCPTWLWGAVKNEARRQKVSENTIVKYALREYLKAYNPNFTEPKEEKEG